MACFLLARLHPIRRVHVALAGRRETGHASGSSQATWIEIVMKNSNAPSAVFVVGHPRSGTSLLASMISSHEVVDIGPESHFFSSFFAIHRVVFSKFGKSARRYLLDVFLNSTCFKSYGIEVSRKILDAYILGAIDHRDLFYEILRLHAAKSQKTVFGEKTPQHALYAAKLLRRDKRCKIIGIVRDPKDVSASLRGMPWNRHGALMHALMWRRYIRALTSVSKSYPDRVLIVRYEDLVTRPADIVATLCHFLHIDYSEQMLQPRRWPFSLKLNDTTNAASTKPIAIKSSSVGTWRTRLDPSEAAVIERITGSWMHHYGYSLETKEPLLRLLRPTVKLGAHLVVRLVPRPFVQGGRLIHMIAGWLMALGRSHDVTGDSP